MGAGPQGFLDGHNPIDAIPLPYVLVFFACPLQPNNFFIAQA